MKTKWLDRRIAAPGPHLTLCLTKEEFKAAMKPFKRDDMPLWLSGDASATMTYFKFDGKRICIVSIDRWQGRDPVEVAGLLVHEAVHIFQQYCDDIGEDRPGSEQQAYGIQSIAQELLAEFARRQPNHA